MTNLDKLADDLIALINSKPRSPTREEVVALLVAQYQPSAPSVSRDGGAYLGWDPAAGPDYTATVVWKGGAIQSMEVDSPYLVSQAQLEKAISCNDGHDWDAEGRCYRCGCGSAGLA